MNNKGVEYVEKYDNHFVGVLNEHNNQFFAKFTNSFGQDSSIEGHWYKLGFVYIFWGKAFGYSKHPKGFSYAGFGFQFKNKIRMLLPGIGEGLDRSWLNLRADIRRYEDG